MMFFFAYIDPGAGSYVFQVILAAVIAVPFVLKSFFKKIFEKSKEQ